MTRHLLRAFLAGTAMLALTGCQTLPLGGGDTVTGPLYQPSNVHRSAERLPVSLRSVAVLPVAARAGDAESSGARAITPELLAGFQRLQSLETIPVSPDDLSRWSGRPDWTTAETLPAGFLESVRARAGADAVLFPEVTTYRAYPPLALGLKLTLVEVQSGRVLWSVDELLDAGNPAVANGARQFYLDEMRGSGPTPFDSHSVLDSPRRFSRFAIATLLGTVPTR